MTHDSVVMRMIAIILIGGACFVASLLVLALTDERQNRSEVAREEIAGKWGSPQVVAGPILVYSGGDEERVLPETIRVESQL
ncbi:MAG: inner membrane CreD family protein, partial [Patescibacteria group bacterium]